MRILLLCTYPVGNPCHGGQIRAHNIAEAYRAAGHEVRVAGVLGSESYPDEEGFDSFPGYAALSELLAHPFLMEDWGIGKLYGENDFFFERLYSRISFVPDVIHIEQPWLFRFASRFAERCNPAAKLLYGSQNVECTLKGAILSTYVDAQRALEGHDLVKRVELEAIAGADAVVCVSGADLEWVASMGAKRTILAPNGVSVWNASDTGVDLANQVSQRLRFALYCASAHAPNVKGFFKMFGGGFGSLAPDQRLVVAGGAGPAIAGDEQMDRSALLRERVIVAGVVDKRRLDGLLETCHCIVLPITEGGGTNLKTAEALWSGKHIVATTIAMRGFEQFMTAAGVTIADTPEEFKRALRCKMQANPMQLSVGEKEERRVVLWDNCLRTMAEMLEQLDANAGR